MGLGESATCLGVDWYNGGEACSEPYWDRINYTATLRVLLAEPRILIRQTQLLADTLQNLHLELGKTIGGELFERQEKRLNLWSELKAAYFPRGLGLLAATLLLAGGAAWTWKKMTCPPTWRVWV